MKISSFCFYLTPKIYETPYGEVEVSRYVYQSSKGGKVERWKGGRIYCPLEHNARIICNATPRFAQQITHKYVTMNAPTVCRDLADNHHRKISHSYVQAVTDWVVQQTAKERDYKMNQSPAISLDSDTN